MHSALCGVRLESKLITGPLLFGWLSITEYTGSTVTIQA